MDRRRAAAALLALAACFACSAAAPTANNQTALELLDGPTEGCYYNFQHYGEGDRIMTNEPCLNCTCHNRMLMCYLRVCPFTKPIGQDCTVEKRADQCCPIVTCPDVPVDLLTSTSTSSPAEYGSTGVGKYDRYGCSINGKYFSEGSKVPSTPNKPCEHCYCIRNMTTCVMQECTLHVDGCTPIYHKDVCCPVRYSCDHEDEIPLLDDMTTTERPTPGYILTTTTVLPFTQMTQDCVHDDQIFPDGALIKTEKACEHCYCMKGDIVCVVQECGTPMENEGKNCTSLPPRHGQCCPDTYICEGDDRDTDLTTETTDLSTQPPRRTGDEGSGYRNEPDEPFTDVTPLEIETEGSGEDYVTAATIHDANGEANTEKDSPDMIDEMLLATTVDEFSPTTEPDKGQNTIPDTISDKLNIDLLKPEKVPIATETNEEFGTTTLVESKTTASDEFKHDNEQAFITTESSFRKEDNNMVSDEIITIKDNEKSSTPISDLVDETTPNVIHLVEENIAKDHDFVADTTTKDYHLIDEGTDNKLETQDKTTTKAIAYTLEDENDTQEKDMTTENQPLLSTTEITPESIEKEISKISTEHSDTGITIIPEKTDIPETTSANPVTNEVDNTESYPGRIPGEGDCLLNGITYTNNSLVPSTNNCHTSCKCTSSIIKCDPIICSPPPEYMENMNDCQPIYDSPDACCPTYVCSGKETIPPQSHSQMSGTESPIIENECNDEKCSLNKEARPDSSISSTCVSADCLNKPDEKQEQTHVPPLVHDCLNDKCEIAPVSQCKGDECENKPHDLEVPTKPILEIVPPVICTEKDGCEKPKDSEEEKCQDENCRRKGSSEVDNNNIEIPEKHILSTNDEPTTDMSQLDVMKQTETSTVSSEISSVSETLSEQHISEEQGEYAEEPTTQKIPKKSDDAFISTEKSYTNLPGVTDAMKPIEEISNEPDSLTTKTPELEGNKEDIVVDTTQTERATTVKQLFNDDSSNLGTKESENVVTDKTEHTTEKLEIYTESIPASTKPDVAGDKSSEKLATYLYDQGSTEKTITLDKVTEINEISEELTTPSISSDTVTKETELHKTPELSEEYNTERSPAKQPESAETSVLLELSTTKTSEVVIGGNTDRYDIPEENTSDISEFNTESNIILTDHTQSIETKKDGNSNDITPEILTYTETPLYLSTKTEEIDHEVTTQQSLQNTDSLLITQVKLETSDSETPSTENTEQEHTPKQTEISQEINTQTPLIPFTKIDEPVTETITEKQYDFTVKDTELTKEHEHESTTIEKLDVYTDSPKIYTTISDQRATEKYKEQDSSSNLPELYTTSDLDLTGVEQAIDIKDIPTKDSNSLVSEKVSDFDKTTLENVKLTTVKSIEQSTEKLVPINTETTSLETIPEKIDVIQSTSIKPSLADEQEINKLLTIIPDNILNRETTTVSRDSIDYDGQTQTPLLTDDKTQTLSMETSTKLSLGTNKGNEITTPLLTDTERILTTQSSQFTSQNEESTEQYNIELQKKNATLDDSLSQQDLTTQPTLNTEMNVDVISTSKIQGESSTTNPQELDEEEKKSSPPLIETEISSSTTSPTLKEKVTETLAYTTETIVNLDEENANKQYPGVVANEQMSTTDKTLLDEEHLPISADENRPEEGTTQNVNFDVEYGMPTEKVIITDTFETEGPTHIITTEPSLTEFSMIHTNIDNNEEISRLPDTYATSTESENVSTHVQSDELSEVTHKPSFEIEDKEQILTTTTFILSEDEKAATVTPTLLVTHKTPMIIENISEKNLDESVFELTTKVSHDHTVKTDEDHIELDLYTTESNSQSTEFSKHEIAQKDEKIMTTESPAYTTTSNTVEDITPTLHEKVIIEQEFVDEKQKDQKESDDARTTSPHYDTFDSESTTTVPIKEETLGTDDQRKTPEKTSSHIPDYETETVSDIMITEKPKEEITTIPSKLLETGNDNTVTNPAGELEITTVHSELYHHETEASDKNEESDNLETMTTEGIKSNIIETNEAVTIAYHSKETISTDKPTETVTESKELTVTEISEVNEIASEITTESTKHISEKQEFEKTEFTNEGIETTDLPYVTLADHKESSTEQANINTQVTDENVADAQEMVTIASEGTDEPKTEKPTPSYVSDYPEATVSLTEYQTESDNSEKIETTNTYTQLPTESITEKKDEQQSDVYSTQPPIEKETKKPLSQETLENISTESIVTDRLPNIPDLSLSTEKYDDSNLFNEKYSTTNAGYKYSETTPYLVELTEHAHHLVDEPTTRASLEDITTVITESQQPERGDQIPEDLSTNKDEYQTSEESKTTVPTPVDENIQTTLTPSKTETEVLGATENIPSSSINNKVDATETDVSPALDGGEASTTLPQIIKDYTTELPEKQQTSSLSTFAYDESSTKKDFSSEKPEMFEEKTTSEVTKLTTSKPKESSSYLPPHTSKPEEKPFDTILPSSTQSPDVHKPELTDDLNEDLPAPDIPPSGSGGYGQEEYVDEDQAFGPGTCRYGGKVYVSAQQIPRDDPCDFCFCFRSDIICLQQSCPPPIHGCHEEPIQGFCCPRYECPVSMATTMNVTTTTTTTTTTLPPHFLPHAYKGAAQRKGCQIKGHTYKVGEVVRASSGPCLHCTCGGDGQMKCDPKACTPEPMLRQMIAAAVSAKRRR